MVNNLHSLGPGSVRGGGEGEGAKRLKTRGETAKKHRPAKRAYRWNGDCTDSRTAQRYFFGATPQVLIYVGERRCRDDAEQHFLCTNTPDPPRKEDNFPLGPIPPPPRVSHQFVY